MARSSSGALHTRFRCCPSSSWRTLPPNLCQPSPPLLLLLPTPCQPLPLLSPLLLPSACSGLDRKAAALAELAADAGGDLSPRSRQAYQRIHREFDRLIARAREEVETAEALAAVAGEPAGECRAGQGRAGQGRAGQGRAGQQLLLQPASKRASDILCGWALQHAWGVWVLACSAPQGCGARACSS